MSSPFDFSSVIETIIVANVRVLPNVVDNFGFDVIYDTIVALNPLVTASWVIALSIVLQILLSALTRSYAWNDRLWSVIPPVCAVLYAIHPVISSDRRTGGSFDPRLSLMCCLVVIWGVRLTFNAARRGYYTPSFVDYRYGWIQAEIINNRFIFALMYASACTVLTILLGLITSPLYFAWVQRGLDLRLSPLDVIATAGMIACIALEAVADNQQYAFQKQKKGWLQKSDKERESCLNKNASHSYREFQDGFLQSGLFSWSRHPNFFAEVCTWWFFYIFSVAASRRWLNWTVVAPLLYTLLFQGTTPLTENISARKYPAYSEYQKRVSRLIPMFSSRTTAGDKQKKKD